MKFPLIRSIFAAAVVQVVFGGGCCWKSENGYQCIGDRDTEELCLAAEGGGVDGDNIYYAAESCGDDCTSRNPAPGGCCWKGEEGYQCINPRAHEEECKAAEGGGSGGDNIFMGAGEDCVAARCEDLNPEPPAPGGCCWKGEEGYQCINDRADADTCMQAEGGGSGGENIFMGAGESCVAARCEDLNPEPPAAGGCCYKAEEGYQCINDRADAETCLEAEGGGRGGENIFMGAGEDCVAARCENLNPEPPAPGGCCYKGEDGYQCINDRADEATCRDAEGGGRGGDNLFMGAGQECTEARCEALNDDGEDEDDPEEPAPGGCCYKGEEGYQCINGRADEATCRDAEGGGRGGDNIFMGAGEDCTDARCEALNDGGESEGESEDGDDNESEDGDDACSDREEVEDVCGEDIDLCKADDVCNELLEDGLEDEKLIARIMSCLERTEGEISPCARQINTKNNEFAEELIKCALSVCEVAVQSSSLQVTSPILIGVLSVIFGVWRLV